MPLAQVRCHEQAAADAHLVAPRAKDRPTAVTTSGPPSFARMVATASGTTVVASLPVFLIGALAVDLTRDLGFGPAGLGGLIAVSRGSSAVAAMPMGILADRIGPARSLRFACFLASVVFVGIGVTASNWLSTAGWMVVGGCALVLSEPAANAMLIHRVATRQQGMAFGIKQASLPVAATLSGLSVPLVGITLGWRWAFLLPVPVALAALVAIPPIDVASQSRRRRGGSTPRLGNHGTLLLLGAAFGLGTASALVVPGFYVSAAVDAGGSVGSSGAVLAVVSVTAVLTRILSGIASDRIIRRHLVFCAVMLVGGSLGLSLLATGRPVLMAFGAIIAAAGSWGNQGVFWYALLRAFAETPGRITGALAPGGLTGGVLGPLLFGFIAGQTGYRTAWLFAAGTALLSSAGMLVGRRALARALGGSGTASRG